MPCTVSPSFRLGVAALFAGALFFFGNGAAVDHDVFVGDVELDDAAADFLPDQLLHLGGIAGAAARGGHEGAHADIDAEAALDHAGDRADDGGFIGEGFFQRGPVGGLRDFARESS